MGSYSGGANRGYYLTANISQGTNDPANNRTYCYANITLTAQQNYFAGWAASGSFQINGGVVQYWGGNYSMPSNYSTITLGSWEGWIGHDANGNGTISVFSDFDTASSPSYLPDYVSVSASEGLPNYDRSPNAPSINYTYRDAAGTGITVVSNSTSAKNSGPGITDYNFQYSTDNASWSGDQAMGTDLVGSFTGSSQTQNYYVRSRAYNSDGWSGYGSSQLSYGFPSAPQSLTCTASGSVSGRINLSWTAPSTTNGGITGYKIYRKLSTDASFPTTPTATLNGTGTTYADDGLSRGLLYDYKITARNAVSDSPSSQSAYSNTVSSVMAPGIPTAPTLSTVVASTDTFGKVTLTWTKPTNTAGGIVDYYLYADGVVKTSVTGENTLTGDITGLNPRQTYTFTVRARNQFAVNNGLTGDVSNSINRKAPGAPTAPLSLTSEAPFFPPGTVNLSWTAPTDVGTEGGTITGYSIYLAGASTPTKTTTGTATTTVIEDLIPATTYTFVVRARNAIADVVGTFSDPSNSTTATAQGEPNEPTNLTVVSDPLVAGRLILTWTPPVGYNTGFRVYTGAGALVANIATPRLEIDGLVPNTSYSYKVRARNPLTDLTGSEGGPFSAAVAGVVGVSSNQTVPSLAVSNSTNNTFIGTHTIINTTATSMSYSKTASNIPFASVPTSGGSTVNNTNTNLNGTHVISVIGDAQTSQSITYPKAGADIATNTATPSGTMYNNTNAKFNGSYEVLDFPAPDSVNKTLSYFKVNSNISSRAGAGTVTNNTNVVYNGEHTISDITDTTISYNRANDDLPETDAFGVVTDKTNQDIFNGTFTLVDTPDHKTVEYSTGDLTYAENLITNPSFEAVQSGSTVLRTNLITNPSFDTNVTGWAGTNASIARSADQAKYGTHSALVSPSSNTGSVGFVVTLPASSIYTFSAWVYCSENKNLKITGGSTVAVTEDTWTRISYTTGTLSGSQTFSIESVDSTTPFYVDGVMLESGSLLRPYFDGASTDELGWDYGWSGTAHASTSIASALATTVRTNLVTNPSFETNVSLWTASTATATRVTTDYYTGIASCQIVTSGAYGSIMSDKFAITASSTYTVSAYIKAAAGVGVELRLFEYDSGATSIGTATFQSITATGAWQRVSVTRTMLSNGATASIRVAGTSAGVTLYVDAVLLEASSTVGDYFDGSSAPVGDFSFAWTGTANASTSIQRGAATSAVTLYRSALVSSSEWSSSGGQSLRIIPNNTTDSSSLAWVAGTTSSLTGNGVTFVAGTTYTVKAKLRLSAAQTGTISSDAARQIRVLYNTQAGFTGATYLKSTQAPNSAGVTEHSVTFTIPSGAVWCAVELWNGASAGNGNVWWDDLMLAEGTYTGSYFDGDTDETSTTWPVVYSWAGTPHASKSIREVGGTLPEIGAELLTPYGDATRVQSEAQLQIRYRSGWLG